MPRTISHAAPKMELCDAALDTLSVAARAGDREGCYAVLSLLAPQIGVTLPAPVKEKSKTLTPVLFKILKAEQARFIDRITSKRASDRNNKAATRTTDSNFNKSSCEIETNSHETGTNSRDNVPSRARSDTDTDTDTDINAVAFIARPKTNSDPGAEYTPSYIVDDWAAFQMQAHNVGLTDEQLDAWRDYYAAQGWRFKPNSAHPMTRTDALASVRNWARAEKRMEIKRLQADASKFAPPPEKGGIDTTKLGI